VAGFTVNRNDVLANDHPVAERDDAGVAVHFRVGDESCGEPGVQRADVA